MQWTKIPGGKLYAAGHQFMTALGEDADTVVNRINSDPGFVARLVKFASNNGFEPSTSQVKAREIMGQNFLGIEEAGTHFGVNPTKQQLAYLAQIPFSEEELTACKDTHILVAVFPISILEIRDKCADHHEKVFDNQGWYDKQSFARDKGEVSWHLIAKNHVKNSTHKTWDEQQKLLAKSDETPTARVLIYMMVGHFLTSGERLLTAIYVRCSDLESDGYRVYVGSFASGGLSIFRYSDDSYALMLGVSSSRKQ